MYIFQQQQQSVLGWSRPQEDGAGKSNPEEQLKGSRGKTANSAHWKGRWSRGGQVGQAGGKPAKTANTKPGSSKLQGGSCPEPLAAPRMLKTAESTETQKCPQPLTASCIFSVKKNCELKQWEVFQHQIAKTKKTKTKTKPLACWKSSGDGWQWWLYNNVKALSASEVHT